MDIVCEFCDKSFDSKSKINVHQRTKKCQQFRTITFVCRKCSSAILGYDNILFHVENCNGTTPILHKEIENRIKLQTIIKNMTTIKIFWKRFKWENGLYI